MTEFIKKRIETLLDLLQTLEFVVGVCHLVSYN